MRLTRNTERDKMYLSLVHTWDSTIVIERALSGIAVRGTHLHIAAAKKSM